MLPVSVLELEKLKVHLILNFLNELIFVVFVSFYYKTNKHDALYMLYMYSYFVLSLSVVNRVVCSASIFFLTCVWYGFSLKPSSLLHNGHLIIPSPTNNNNDVHVNMYHTNLAEQ